MKIKQKYMLLLLIFSVTLLQGCTTFKVPTGVWTCEKLGITVNFDDSEGLYGSAIPSRGTIVIDGEERNIICKMDATGSCGFAPIEDMGKSMEETNYFYIGRFNNNGANKMIFRVVKTKKEYTFIRKP